MYKYMRFKGRDLFYIRIWDFFFVISKFLQIFFFQKIEKLVEFTLENNNNNNNNPNFPNKAKLAEQWKAEATLCTHVRIIFCIKD